MPLVVHWVDVAPVAVPLSHTTLSDAQMIALLPASTVIFLSTVTKTTSLAVQLLVVLVTVTV